MSRPCVEREGMHGKKRKERRGIIGWILDREQKRAGRGKVKTEGWMK